MADTSVAILWFMIIAIIGFYPVSCTKSTRTGQCFGLPTYSALKTGPYQCKLWQPNWASETAFEMTFKHCQENPTINLFVRNFYAADEINTDFNPQFRKWRFTLYTGTDAQFIIIFKPVKANPKKGIRSQVRILVIFKPDYFQAEQQQLLTGVFFTDMKDDCNIFESMAPHNLIFLSLGLFISCILIPIAVTFFIKWRKSEGAKKKNKKSFWKWLFRCEQQQQNSNNNRSHEHAHQMNGNARQMNGHARHMNGDAHNMNGDAYEMNGDTYHLNGDAPTSKLI